MKNSLLLIGIIIFSSCNSTLKMGFYEYGDTERYDYIELKENQTFEYSNSNCTEDEIILGKWKQKEDTLILNSDIKPNLTVTKHKYKPTKEGEKERIFLTSKDPALLNLVNIQVCQNEKEPYSLRNGNLLDSNNQLQGIRLNIKKYNINKAFEYQFKEGNDLYLEVKFSNLNKPYFHNEMWLIDGKKIYLNTQIPLKKTSKLRIEQK